MHTSATDMKNHTNPHQSQADIGAFEPVHPERFAAAQKSTWVSIGINVLLTTFQVSGGFFAHSQALMADGLHSLSDLLSDVLVLYANRHGNRHADANHPYGHARVETAATLILGTFLAVAKRVRSQMLVANAWHARSDAASSLVVIVGVVGNLLGYTFLDLVAAA